MSQLLGVFVLLLAIQLWMEPEKTEYLIGRRKWSHTFSVAWLRRKTDLDNLLHSELPQGHVLSEEPSCTIATAAPTSHCFPLLNTGKKRVIHAVYGERLISKPIFGSLPILKCLSFHRDVGSLYVSSYWVWVKLKSCRNVSDCKKLRGKHWSLLSSDFNGGKSPKLSVVIQRYRLLSSSCLTKTRVQKNLQSSAQVPWQTCSSGRDLHRYHQRWCFFTCTEGCGCATSATLSSAQGCALPLTVSLLQCTYHRDRTGSLKSEVVVAFFWKSLFCFVVGSSLSDTAFILGSS